MNYNDISRRGLIKLNNDYDKANDNALHNFLNENNALYEHIRPFEQIAERLDGISETLKDKGDSVSNAMMDRVEHVFDSLVQSMTDEIQRCDSVIDECEDDESYPDDDDDEEE